MASDQRERSDGGINLTGGRKLENSVDATASADGTGQIHPIREPRTHRLSAGQRRRNLILDITVFFILMSEGPVCHYMVHNIYGVLFF